MDARNAALAGFTLPYEADELEDGSLDVLVRSNRRKLLINIKGNVYTFSGINIDNPDGPRVKGRSEGMTAADCAWLETWLKAVPA